MASGFGTFNSSKYITVTSAGGAKVNAVVSQSVNAAARTVTVTVRASATYYRISGSWSISNGTAIYGSQTSGTYIQAVVGDQTNKYSGSIGLAGAKSFTASAGGNYTIPGGHVKARSGYTAERTATKTYTYAADGSAITGTWSATLLLKAFSNTAVTVSGSFTTDSITPTQLPPSGVTATLDSVTQDTITLDVAVEDYGEPATADGRYISGVVTSTGVFDNQNLVEKLYNVSSGTVTITNDSEVIGEPLELAPNTEYRYAAYAHNTVSGTQSDILQVYTLPTDVSSVVVNTIASDHSNITISRPADGGALVVAYEYTTDGDDWVFLGTDSTYNIPVTSGEITVRATSSAGHTAGKTIEIKIDNRMYGSVNGQAVKIKKQYGSVNGQAVRIIKTYASVNGVAKMVYKG